MYLPLHASLKRPSPKLTRTTQSWFVNGFSHFNLITPATVLTLFIVSVLALAWSVMTLIRMGSTRRSAGFVAFVDLLFFGALIGGVVELGPISKAPCGHFESSSLYYSLGPFGYEGRELGKPYYDPSKSCKMLKASFALGIMNVVFFWFTFFLALFLRRRRDEVVREKTTTTRRRRRRRSGSRRGSSRA
jgi:hypothetical protein